MRIKLLVSVLVEDADTIPTRDGTEMEMDNAKAAAFIANGIAVEVVPPAPLVPVLPPTVLPADVAAGNDPAPDAGGGGAEESPATPQAKQAPVVRNKKAPDPSNKGV